LSQTVLHCGLDLAAGCPLTFLPHSTLQGSPMRNTKLSPRGTGWACRVTQIAEARGLCINMTPVAGTTSSGRPASLRCIRGWDRNGQTHME
jgi:hypothetical protein